ncbi:MAG TPA: hypothetical protein VJ599_04325, partial [Nitrososphaeraceae archaeon]|nr:hypothetical protein [Nitrososphaeraceae archaeon]
LPSFHTSKHGVYNAAGIMSCKPALIQPMLMSIIFEHYRQLKEIDPEKNFLTVWRFYLEYYHVSIY